MTGATMPRACAERETLQLTIRAATPADAAAYGALHQSAPDALIQHSWAWRDVIAESSDDTPHYFLAHTERGELVGALPAVQVHGPYGDLLLSLPLPGAYGGVFSSLPTITQQASVRRALLQHFVGVAADRGCMLATIATSPFARDTADYATDFAPDFVRDNFVQYIDLDDWNAHEPVSASVAKYVKRARTAKVKHGLRVEMSGAGQSASTVGTVGTVGTAKLFASPESSSADVMRYTAWEALHAARMREIHATPLPTAFLRAIRHRVIEHGHGTMMYVVRDNQVVAGCMFVGHRDVLDCFLLSSSTEGDRVLATSVLIVEALQWAKANGFRIFNWQSSSSRESGVYHFKNKWGSLEGSHQYLTRITGDISHLRRVPLSDVRAAYPWRYVMPFEQFTSQP